MYYWRALWETYGYARSTREWFDSVDAVIRHLQEANYPMLRGRTVEIVRFSYYDPQMTTEVVATVNNDLLR
jgi:hypothetical protein